MAASVAPLRALPLLPFNEHFITTERRSQYLTECALARALDLMILGYISEANRIVTVLYQHDALQFENDDELFRGMCFAWSQSGLWPSFMLEPDLSKPGFRREGDLRFGRDDVDVIMDKWQQEEQEKYLPQLHESSSTCYGSRHRDIAVVLADMDRACSSNDENRVNQNLDEHVVSELRLLSSSSNTYLDKYYANDHGEKTKRKPLTNCRSIWPILCTQIIAQRLNISDEAITAYVNKGISLLEHRFKQGRTRIFADKSIPEVVAHLDTDSLYLQNTFLVANPDPPASKLPGWKVYTTYTAPPASEEAITSLESRLNVALPEDYKTFLHHTSCFGEDARDAFGWAYSPDEIDYCTFAQEYPIDAGDFMLLPDHYLSSDLGGKMLWPEDLPAFDIGAGGDQGYVWMFGREQIKVVSQEFEEVYAASSESEKRVFERAAKDLYGGLEEMRALEWLVVFWSRGNMGSLPFGSFRAYLEYAAEEKMLFRDMDDYEADKRRQQEEDDQKDKGQDVYQDSNRVPPESRL